MTLRMTENRWWSMLRTKVVGDTRATRRSATRPPQVEGLEERICQSSVQAIAGGINYPRGLAFGRNGAVFVATAGTGGNRSTIPSGTRQVPSPVGPYTGGRTASILRIAPTGQTQTIAKGLPSGKTYQTPPQYLGAASVAFLNNKLYALVAGGGASHGNPGMPNGIYQINRDGSYKLVANLSAYARTNPVANPSEFDYEPDGDWYSLVAANGVLYAVDPNRCEVVKINPATGKVARVADLSATVGHVVPTGLAYSNGSLYVGTVGAFLSGSTANQQNVYKVTLDGKVSVAATGFTGILGLAVDRQDRLYVLQSFTGNDFPTGDTSGNVVRINKDGSREIVAKDLIVPTGIAIGPDGALYVSNAGFGYTPDVKAGNILRIEV